MSYAVVDGCPVPRPLARQLALILSESGATLQSCYRGTDAEGLLAKLGKSSQRQLYEGWLARRPGFNPANRPGQSTHELRSDGVAYRGPVGRVLAWWQVGIDVDDAHVQRFIQRAAAHGWTAAVTYPNSRSEYHHLNLRKAPQLELPALKRGSRGPRVLLLTRRLTKLGLLDRPRLRYDGEVVLAVKSFQRRHHQKPDGIAGAQTLRQLLVAARAHRKAPA